MRSRPSNLLANHRVSEHASSRLPLFCHPRSFFHPRAGREKGERFITAFIARRVLAARIAGWIGLWRLLNFDVTKSLFHSRLCLAPLISYMPVLPWHADVKSGVGAFNTEHDNFIEIQILLWNIHQ